MTDDEEEYLTRALIINAKTFPQINIIRGTWNGHSKFPPWPRLMRHGIMQISALINLGQQ